MHQMIDLQSLKDTVGMKIDQALINPLLSGLALVKNAHKPE